MKNNQSFYINNLEFYKLINIIKYVCVYHGIGEHKVFNVKIKIYLSESSNIKIFINDIIKIIVYKEYENTQPYIDISVVTNNILNDTCNINFGQYNTHHSNLTQTSIENYYILCNLRSYINNLIEHFESKNIDIMNINIHAMINNIIESNVNIIVDQLNDKIDKLKI